MSAANGKLWKVTLWDGEDYKHEMVLADGYAQAALTVLEHLNKEKEFLNPYDITAVVFIEYRVLVQS